MRHETTDRLVYDPGVSDYTHLKGHRFPGGRVTAWKHLAWLWTDAVGGAQPTGAVDADRRAEVLHPSFVFALAIEGMGLTIEEVLALADTTPDGGAVAGGIEFEFKRPIEPDARYEVEAEIVDVERKSGARTGPFDRFAFRVSLFDPETRELVASNTNTWIIPRREG